MAAATRVAELGMGVEPGAHGRAAGGQLVEAGQRQLDALEVGRRAGPRSRRTPGPRVSGTASIRWVRPILVMSAKATALSCSASRSAADRREEPVHDLLDRGDVHGGREGVVGRLRHVDVVVGVDRLLGAHHAAGQLDGPVGDDLVGVHVGLRAAAGLPDAQREVVVELALGHLAGRLLDQRRPARSSSLPRSRLTAADAPLRMPKARISGSGIVSVADVEVVQRALRLGTPVPVGGDLDLPHAVAFHPGVRHERQLRTGATGHSEAREPAVGLRDLVSAQMASAAAPVRPASPSSSRMAASRVGTPSLRRMDDTWLRTVVGETKSRSGDLGRAGALAHELEHVPLAPGEAGRLAVGHGHPAVLAVAEFVDQAGHEGPGQRRPPRPAPAASASPMESSSIPFSR